MNILICSSKKNEYESWKILKNDNMREKDASVEKKNKRKQ